MRIVIFIIVAIIMVVIANKKGFNPWLWVLAGGLLGFLILVFLPSANAKEIDEETIARRKKNGNTAGGIITAIAIVAVIVTIGVLSSH